MVEERSDREAQGIVNGVLISLAAFWLPLAVIVLLLK